MRFNNFTIKGHENDVGRNVTALARRSCDDIKWHNPTMFQTVYNCITYCPLSGGMANVARRVRQRYGSKYHEIGVERCKMIGEEAGLDQPRRERASIGLVTLGYLKDLYEVIYICGFDNLLKPNFKAKQQHYFKKPPKDDKYHNWEKETNYIQHLITINKVRLLT